MSPRGIYNRNKEEVKPEVKVEEPKTDLQAKMVVKKFENEVKKNHFLDIEIVPPVQDSPLTVYNKNLMYAYRWCNKDLMATGRKGIWNTIPRDHPDFAGLRVSVDHSPNQNFFTYRDLVLCCCRAETAKSKRQRLDEKIRRRDARLQQEEETVIKATKENISQGIKTLENAIGKQESVSAF